jgi:hypothetical protein
MDSTNPLWSLIFGSIGLGYFIYGKKQSNPVIRYTGLALMIYPYFIINTVVLVLVGICLLYVPRFVKF